MHGTSLHVSIHGKLRSKYIPALHLWAVHTAADTDTDTDVGRGVNASMIPTPILFKLFESFVEIKLTFPFKMSDDEMMMMTMMMMMMMIEEDTLLETKVV